MKVHLTETVERLVQDFAGSLGTSPLSASYRKWSIDHSGNCTSPVTVELHGRPETKNRKLLVLPKEGKHMTAIMEVRCRQCENCLKARAAHWRLRIMSEADASTRTWFGTLTVDPQHRMMSLTRMRAYLDKQGVDYDSLSPEERWREMHRDLSAEVTRWLKRVRKRSGAVLRYVAIAEAHKSGHPHFHVLVHEKDPDQPVRWKHLHDAWTYGFSKWNLVDHLDRRALTYCAKYLSKDISSRVRASLGYGEQGGLKNPNERALLKPSDYSDAKKPVPDTLPAVTPISIAGSLTVEERKREDEFRTLSRVRRASEAVAKSDAEAKSRARSS